ncbi:hypothetical protein M9H77_02911 [Catharanthus roseus]|uniref:Uncharacterized protein n=1 Tax=Catharanthus roseus TaxID=4058 RepID=A0ACC0C9N3_CATRO|nr:hypothetical protein M9H77_02911 [Catharanthus roseus]
MAALVSNFRFHVLAVDDSLIDRKLIERLLKTSSYQALEFLGLVEDDDDKENSSSNHHDVEVNLIITDYCMPGMTGYDLLRKIKESSYLKDIPVVIMPVKQSDVNKLIPQLLNGKGNKDDDKQANNNISFKRKIDIEECCLSPEPTRTTYKEST